MGNYLKTSATPCSKCTSPFPSFFRPFAFASALSHIHTEKVREREREYYFLCSVCVGVAVGVGESGIPTSKAKQRS